MAGEHHRVADLGEALQHLADRPGGHRIHRFERLVEEQHLGTVEQRGRQCDLLAHAGAVVDHQLVLGGDQVEHVEQLTGPVGHQVGGQAPQETAVGEQLQAAEAFVEAEVVGQHADPGLGCRGIGPDVEALDADQAGVGAQQPGHHPDRGGLAGTIGADQAVEAAGRDRQVDAGDGHVVVEALPQASDLHRSERRGRRRPRSDTDAWSRRTSSLRTGRPGSAAGAVHRLRTYARAAPPPGPPGPLPSPSRRRARHSAEISAGIRR